MQLAATAARNLKILLHLADTFAASYRYFCSSRCLRCARQGKLRQSVSPSPLCRSLSLSPSPYLALLLASSLSASPFPLPLPLSLALPAKFILLMPVYLHATLSPARQIRRQPTAPLPATPPCPTQLPPPPLCLLCIPAADSLPRNAAPSAVFVVLYELRLICAQSAPVRPLWQRGVCS